MSNMSYCRFENTLRDMRDCLRAIQTAGGIENYVREEEPSSYELNAIKEMEEVASELAAELEGSEDLTLSNSED